MSYEMDLLIIMVFKQVFRLEFLFAETRSIYMKAVTCNRYFLSQIINLIL